jgi:hypothetical protein
MADFTDFESGLRAIADATARISEQGQGTADGLKQIAETLKREASSASQGGGGAAAEFALAAMSAQRQNIQRQIASVPTIAGAPPVLPPPIPSRSLATPPPLPAKTEKPEIAEELRSASFQAQNYIERAAESGGGTPVLTAPRIKSPVRPPPLPISPPSFPAAPPPPTGQIYPDSFESIQAAMLQAQARGENVVQAARQAARLPASGAAGSGGGTGVTGGGGGLSPAEAAAGGVAAGAGLGLGGFAKLFALGTLFNAEEAMRVPGNAAVRSNVDAYLAMQSEGEKYRSSFLVASGIKDTFEDFKANSGIFDFLNIGGWGFNNPFREGGPWGSSPGTDKAISDMGSNWLDAYLPGFFTKQPGKEF